MFRLFHTCKKIVGTAVCALGIGILLYAIFPAWMVVVLLALMVVCLGAACFLC